MSYTPTNWANGKAPALNADNLNKIEEELAKLDKDVSNLAEVVAKPDITTTDQTTMQNSHDGRLKVEEIVGGESQQDSTAGNQLFDKNADGVKNGYYLSTSGAEVASTVSSISDYIDVSNIDSAYLSYGGSNTSAKVIGYYDANKTFITYGEYTQSKALTIGDYAYIRFTYVTADADLLMLNAGTTALPYEPYTGGIPSPNPSYPQEIKKTVVSEIKTHGKNFYKPTKITETKGGITIDVHKDGTVVANGTATANVDIYPAETGTWENETGMYILSGCPSGGSDTTYRLYVNNGLVYKNDSGKGSQEFELVNGRQQSLFIRFYSGVTVSNLVFKPMIRKADVADATYEPYTESAITLSQPIELYGIGDVKDAIEGGKVKRKFSSVVFDGSADEVWNGSSTVGKYYMNNWGCKYYGFLMCSQAKGVQNGNEELNTCYIHTASNGRFIINTEFATLEEWKAHLASNPMTVVYELAEETTEELPIADQIALNSLSTYDGITYLEFDSEIEPTFKGEYGTSKVGGYTLEGMLAGRNGELLAKSNSERINALETSVVNNI